MGHTLLLADDSVTIQRVIELTFADEDVTVIAVGDGQQAIERIEAEPPDIVLADIDMPERDGFEVANFVKQNPELKRIPVILLTGAFDPVDEARVAAAGCDGILAKPFEPQLLINRVKQLLAASDRAARPAAGSSVPAISPAGEATPSPAASGSASLDDYFDQLDAAFSALNARDVAGRPAAPPTHWPSETDAVESPAPAWPTGDDVKADVAAPAEPSRRAPDPALATAFSALLSAEQGEPLPAGTLRRSQVGGPTSEVGTDIGRTAVPFDALVEETTRRVIQAIGTQALREQVADVVADIAERLVREEIEKLKASIS
jgi:CheY-like chemotaxis protein